MAASANGDESTDLREREVDPASWQKARKPFWWALFATTIISLIGGFAIYLIHSTTPSTPGSTTVSGKDLSKAVSGGKFTNTEPKSPSSPRASTSSASMTAPPNGSPAPSVGATITSGSQPDPSASLSGARTQAGKIDGGSVVPGSSSTAAGKSVSSQPVSGTSVTSSSVAGSSVAGASPNSTSASSTSLPTSVAPYPVKQSAPNPPLNPPVSADGSASLKWSKDEVSPKKTVEKAKPAPLNPGAEAEGTGSFPPRVISPARPESGLNAAPPPPKPPTQQAAANPPLAQRSGTRAPSSSQNSAPSRLKSAQDAQCADSNFFSRLVCDERVRLRFCRDRWNEHQDCTVQTMPRDL